MRHLHLYCGTVLLTLLLPFACSAQDASTVAKEVETQINLLTAGVTSEQEKAAIEALAALGLSAVPDIARKMREGNHPQIIGGAEALKRMGAPAIDALMAQMSNSPSSEGRADAALALRGLAGAHAEGLDKVTDALVKALDDVFEVTRHAGAALASMHPESDNIYLILTRRLLQPGNNHAYKESLEKMTAAPQEALDLLANAMKEPWEISRQAHEVLYNLGPRAKIIAPRLVDYLREPPFPQQRQIPSLLGVISGDEAVPVLVKVLVSQVDCDFKEGVVAALTSGNAINKERVVAPLIDALSSDTFYPAIVLSWLPAVDALAIATTSPDPLTRQNAIYALGQSARCSIHFIHTTPSPAILPALEAVLLRDDLTDRYLAAMALLELPNQETTVQALERALADPRSDDAGRRILSDALFHASAASKESQMPPVPRYTLIIKQMPTDNPKKWRSSYLIRIANEGEPVVLEDFDGYRPQDGANDSMRMYRRLDDNSIRLAWIAPPLLLQVSWLIAEPQPREQAVSTTAIIAKTEAGWKEVARQAGEPPHSNSSADSTLPFTFTYDPKTQSLRLLRELSIRGSRLLPVLFEYQQYQEWPCTMTDSHLSFEPGTERISTVGEYSPEKYAAVSGATVEVLYGLNPHLRNRKYWAGNIYTSTEVPPISF